MTSPSIPSNIAILGCTGFKNRGVDALVNATISEILSILPNSSITLYTWTPEYDKNRLFGKHIRVENYPYIEHQSPQDRANHTQSYIIKKFLRNMLSKVRSRQRHLINSAPSLVEPRLHQILSSEDVVVITGGDVFSSEYGWASLRYYLSLIHTAHSLSLPVILLGHTIGRFTSLEDLEAWLQVVDKITLLTTRDNSTYKYLDEVNGLPKNTKITSDVAFCLAESFSYPRYHQGSKRPLVSLSISSGVVNWSSISLDQHFLAWKAIIEAILEEMDADIIMIPHVHESYGDDRFIQSSLHREYRFDSRISVASEDLSAAEYKGIIGSTEFMVAERMHAAIASISMNVPTVLAAYSLKAYGLARDAYGEHVMHDRLPIYDVDDYAEYYKAVNVIRTAWNSRDDLCRALEKSVPTLKGLATKNFSNLFEAIV